MVNADSVHYKVNETGFCEITSIYCIILIFLKHNCEIIKHIVKMLYHLFQSLISNLS